MSGKEIIEKLEEIKTEVRKVNLKGAIRLIEYLIEDIRMYKQNSL